ncbi:MAG: acyl carrier protein, partial [Planctomycetales bacterium]|nr:acyl carrier protein [Planctomycetales bacterium]
PALDVLGHLLAKHDRPHAAVFDARWSQMLALYRNGAPPLLAGMASEVQADAGAARQEDQVDHALRNKLLAADQSSRAEMLSAYFAEQLAKIMGLAAADLELTQPLNTLGLDSLMAIELKNTIESRLGATLPIALFMEGPSVVSLAEKVAALLGPGAVSTDAAAAQDANEGAPSSAEDDAEVVAAGASG